MSPLEKRWVRGRIPLFEFQSSLRDEMDCRCRIHGMNPVATIKASLRDAPWAHFTPQFVLVLALEKF
jgi:hypothetical protein